MAREIFLIWPAEVEKQGSLYPPLGISYLYVVLRKNGFNPKVLDLTFDSKLNLIKEINQSNGIYCISILTPLFKRAKEIVSVIRERDSKGTIILGGPHSTMLPKDTLEQLNADIICLGEGEVSLVEVINALENKKSLKNIDGIAYKENNEIKINSKLNYIEDIDKLPFPDQGIFPLDKYFKTRGFRELSIITTRGCPYNCIFCQPTLRTVFGKKLRVESPERVVDEIEWLVKKQKIDLFVVSDDTFSFDKERVRQVCNLIIKRKLNIFWRCQTRVGLDYDTIKLMKKAGCILLALGVESGSQKILNNIRKGITIKQVEETFKICKKIGILAHAYLMVGNIGETEETINETKELVKRIRPFSSTVSITMPNPGTDLYDYALKNNLLLSKDWGDYNRFVSTSTVMKQENISSMEELIKHKEFLEKVQKESSQKFKDIFGLVFDLNFIKIFLKVSLTRPGFLFRGLKLVIKSFSKKGLQLTNPLTKA